MKTLLFAFLSIFANNIFAQNASQVVEKVKARMMQVKDYSADGVLKTDVAFIKAPVSKVKVYYKNPDKFRLKKDGGVSVLPKGGISISLNNVVSLKDFMAIDAGYSVIGGINTRVIKLLPVNDNADIILSTLYIDESNMLVRKAITTTKENGTYEMELFYRRYSNFGLPDKLVFSFNTKDYKLPKGITMEMDGASKSASEKLANKKGSASKFPILIMLLTRASAMRFLRNNYVYK